jgi:hypothetical protein
MKAIKMFEEREYEQILNDGTKYPHIIYRKDDGGHITEIEFITVIPQVRFRTYENYTDDAVIETSLYNDTMLAIHQQLKELGWLDE